MDDRSCWNGFESKRSHGLRMRSAALLALTLVLATGAVGFAQPSPTQPDPRGYFDVNGVGPAPTGTGPISDSPPVEKPATEGSLPSSRTDPFSPGGDHIERREVQSAAGYQPDPNAAGGPTPPVPGYQLTPNALGTGSAPPLLAATTDGVEKPGQGPIALSVGVLVFAGLIFGLLAVMRIKATINEVYFFKLSCLALVLQAGLFLVVAGYTQSQITPIVGLLGTIVGYVLGKGEEAKS